MTKDEKFLLEALFKAVFLDDGKMRTNAKQHALAIRAAYRLGYVNESSMSCSLEEFEAQVQNALEKEKEVFDKAEDSTTGPIGSSRFN